MVVDVDAGPLPLRKIVARCGQRQQGRTIERLEERATAALEFLKRSLVERVEQAPDLFIEFGEREEGVFAQPGQDSAFNQQYA